MTIKGESHPVWVRGLKQGPASQQAARHQSHPVWVRGLKQSSLSLLLLQLRSHPVWVRGLKLRDAKGDNGWCESHPVWVRGLKPQMEPCAQQSVHVAPRVGAWIETPLSSHCGPLSQSHPVWVRGLKLNKRLLMRLRQASHPVWVRGLKQEGNQFNAQQNRRTPCGCVD